MELAEKWKEFKSPCPVMPEYYRVMYYTELQGDLLSN